MRPRFILPWGKAFDGESHHLAHHCADVAASFEAIASTPVVRARLEATAGRALDAQDIQRLAVLAFLHDAGKLHPGFQAKAAPGTTWRGSRHGHLAEGAAIFGNALGGELGRLLHIDRLIAWGIDFDLLMSVLAHHGSPFQASVQGEREWDLPLQGYDARSSAREIGERLPGWFPLAFQEGGDALPGTAAFQHLICGLVTLADWVGSTETAFERRAALDAAYLPRVRERAKAVVAEIGLAPPLLASERVTFEALVPAGTPRPMQQLVADASIDDRLLILEAATGDGKTEAALWRFARLYAAGMVGGLYFALPTRAAARQIHERVQRAAVRLFGSHAPDAILAVPGYLRAGEHEGVSLPGWEVRWDDDGGADERKRLARWSAEHSKRYLAATLAVGTVDQVMLAGLRIRHAHMRAAALSRSLLVIDEVHASDPYMTEIQRSLLATHLRAGGHALLMSATLGASARASWIEPARSRVPTPAVDAAVAAPYPALWTSRDRVRTCRSEACESKRVRMELVADWGAERAAHEAGTAAAAGARVLVIRNTVKFAVETYRALLASSHAAHLLCVGGQPIVHHSRFAPEDRTLLDRAAEAALAPDRPNGIGVVVIGTQTLEQSLDIDADLLVTDLCPADVLLQRIGRLHRHRRDRPEHFTQPRCVVLAPASGLSSFVEPRFENGLGAWKASSGLQGIYLNLHACELTRRFLSAEPEWQLPAMNREIVESAVHPERVEGLNEELGPAWHAYWDQVYGNRISEKAAARNVGLPYDRPFSDLQPFGLDEEHIRTRLGEPGAPLQFPEPMTSPFGVTVDRITPPAHWLRGVEPQATTRVFAEGDAIGLEIGDRRFRYDHTGLERIAANTESTSA